MKKSISSIHLQSRAGIFRGLLFVVALAVPAVAGTGPAGEGQPCPVEIQKSSSRTNDPRVAAASLREAVSALDRIRAKVEEWGVVTISEPVAVLDDTAFYVPSNIVAPEDLYKQATTEVEASSYQLNQTGFSNEATGNFSPLISMPGAPNAAPGSGTVVTTKPGATVTQTTNTTSKSPSAPAPTADAASIPGIPAPAAGAPADQSGTNSAQSSQTLALLPDVATQLGSLPQAFGIVPNAAAPTKGATEALREAEDNTIRQKIYTQMSYPKTIPGHAEVIFAIVQVSCNPGWRTKEHYTADCSANVEYYDLCNKQHLSRGEMRAPTVFSVLPLVDAQTVEMANSQRQITQLAVQLGASLPAHGVKVNVNDLMKFVRHYAKDMRTVTPIPVVNSYSSGSTFGFRFSPSFQAERDPAAKNSGAANVLLPTTFPALITVVMHYQDLEYAQQTLGAQQMGLLTHVSTRWYLKDRRPLWQLPMWLVTPMRRDTSAMEVNAAGDVQTVYNAKRIYYKNSKPDQSDDQNESDLKWSSRYDEMRREILALEAKGVGRDWPIPLPNWTAGQRLFDPDAVNAQKKANQAMQDKEDAARSARESKGAATPAPSKAKAPALSVSPTDATLDPAGGDLTLIVSGNGVDQTEKATLGAIESTAVTANAGSELVVFKVAAFGDGDKLSLALEDKDGKQIATAPASVTLHKKKPDSTPTPAGATPKPPAGSPKPAGGAKGKKPVSKQDGDDQSGSTSTSSAGSDDARDAHPSFNERFAILPDQGLAANGFFNAPAAELPFAGALSTLLGARRPSLPTKEHPPASAENPLLPPLPEP